MLLRPSSAVSFVLNMFRKLSNEDLAVITVTLGFIIIVKELVLA
jgi:hypothetical protein